SALAASASGKVSGPRLPRRLRIRITAERGLRLYLTQIKGDARVSTWILVSLWRVEPGNAGEARPSACTGNSGAIPCLPLRAPTAHPYRQEVGGSIRSPPIAKTGSGEAFRSEATQRPGAIRTSAVARSARLRARSSEVAPTSKLLR